MADGVAAAESVRLIDVIWLDRQTQRVAAAFEVEHSTSIHSGIVRMLDWPASTILAGALTHQNCYRC